MTRIANLAKMAKMAKFVEMAKMPISLNCLKWDFDFVILIF